MQILSPRFFVLPIIALTVIASLPAPKETSARTAAPVVQRAVDCDGRLGVPSCSLAANMTQKVVR